jgi:hypothetical protein
MALNEFSTTFISKEPNTTTALRGWVNVMLSSKRSNVDEPKVGQTNYQPKQE